MTNKVIRLIVSLLLLSGSILSLNAQLAGYNFNANAEDQVGGYHATTFGAPTFEDGAYISFTPGDYLSLPLSLSEAIDVSESWQIELRFKVEGDWRATEGEEAQVILSNKIYDQRLGGFDITAREWGGQLQLITTFGDGVVYAPGDCVSCCTECTQSEGKIDWIIDIDSGIWYDVKVKFVFDTDRPYLQYEVNGTVSISYFNNFDPKADPEGFRQTINKQQIWVGADQNNDIFLNQPRFPKMDLQVDHLSFSSPIPAGNADKVGQVLQALIDHMNSSASAGNGTGTDSALSPEEVDSLRRVFVQHWDDQSYAENHAVIWSYINTYAEKHEPVFSNFYNAEKPQDFTPMETIQFIMEQWILDNRYQPETVTQMEGLIFEDHELWPGKVSAQAPRLEKAEFIVDGDYQTDPGFMINGQERVIRPTGYYVAPGELVTIKVPEEAIGKGLSLYVGAHNVNLAVTWNQFRRFPRIMTIYDLDAATITVANPFGGGIYVKVPDGADYGSLTFEVEGAIKAPYYSDKEGFGNSLTEFRAEVANQYVPWADIETKNMKATITLGMATTLIDPDAIFDIWNNSFDAVNTALGRPLERFRAEYLLIDRQNHSAGTAIPAGYPMSFETLVEPYSAEVYMPAEVERGRDWYKGAQANFHNIIFHEQGHLHNMPTMLHEQESNVNMPAAAVYSMAMGETIDSAMVYSNQQKLNLEQAALDWILMDNFYLGNRIGYNVDSQEKTGGEQQYQSRGHAKYVDIAHMFGWEALGDIMGFFYDYQKQNPGWSPYGLGDDQFIEAASEVMGFNMAPHFEFWGIIPSDELVERLSDMPTSEVIKDRIVYFRSKVPANNEAFQPLHQVMTSKLEPHHHVRYDAWKTSYDEALAKRVTDRIDAILSRYYSIDEQALNLDPVITGQTKTLYATINSSITLGLDDLVVEDADNDYPDDFTLQLYAGDNYTFSETTVSPVQDFLGTLMVPVTVNDGLEDSEQFMVEIQVIVENERPHITDLAAAVSGPEDEDLTLTLGDFAVTDGDHTYPDDFSLILAEGDNYSLSGNTITPDLNFFGTIEVPVKVNDGVQDSEVFMAEITIEPVNDPPVLQGQARLFAINEDESIFFRADFFVVRDVDHEAGDYFITVLEGNNYSLDGNTLTPAQDFFGRLTVTVVANDGQDESEPYEMIVEVLPVNDQPVITGLVAALSTEINTSLDLSLTDLTVTDPDNDYPTDFSLSLLEGDNYSISGNTITPATDFTGALSVALKVNDGELDSDSFLAEVSVRPPNVTPVITGLSEALSTMEDTPIALSLSHFVVEDSDNNYPDDFTLSVYGGDNYLVSENTVTPAADFVGQLSVPVSVNDGLAESEQFVALIEVTVVNDKPVITGLTAALTTPEDIGLNLSLSDFEVADPDNDYPGDFNLTVLDGDNYSVSATTVTPDADFAGSLSVQVTVSDGTESSEPFTATLEVTPVNDVPVITGLAAALTTPKETPLTLNLTDFTVTDPDNSYPDEFSLTVLEGSNYTVSESTITPADGFVGTLSVPVTVHDGTEASAQFMAEVQVSPVLGLEDEFIRQNFSIYPNPTTDFLRIVKDQTVPSYQISLISAKGDLIQSSGTVTTPQQWLDLRLLRKGLYILQITSAEGTGNFRVFKQ